MGEAGYLGIESRPPTYGLGWAEHPAQFVRFATLRVARAERVAHRLSKTHTQGGGGRRGEFGNRQRARGELVRAS